MFLKPNYLAPALRMAAVVVFALISTVPGARSAMIPQSLELLSANSSHILRGEAVSVVSQWDEGKTTIYTEVTLRMTQSLKESFAPAENIVIRYPGGESDGIKLWVEHAPEFKVGQDVIVFLRDRGEYYSVTSWVQGKYTVSNNTVSNNAVLEKDLPESVFIKKVRDVVTSERKANGEER